MIFNKVGFKNFYSLFTIAGILLLSTAFLVPQKASAQAAVPAYVPVRDEELISAFKIFNPGPKNIVKYMLDLNLDHTTHGV